MAPSRTAERQKRGSAGVGRPPRGALSPCSFSEFTFGSTAGRGPNGLEPPLPAPNKDALRMD
eukprot:4548787-Prymnesium_polylepis.1